MKLVLKYSQDGRLEGFEFDDDKKELSQLVHEVRALRIELKTLGDKIMSQVSDFAAKVNVAFDTLGTSVDGLVVDVKTLNDEITKLQGSQGVLSPEDQTLLDGITTRAQAIADKAKALDDLTAPPAIPQP